MSSSRLLALLTAAFFGTAAQAAGLAPAPPVDTTVVPQRDSAAKVPAHPRRTIATTQKKTPPPIKVSEVEPENGPLVDLLKAEAAKARAAGLMPFIEFGGPTCANCQELKSHFDNLWMRDAFRGTYIVEVDAEHWTRQDDWKAQLDKVLGVGHRAIALPAFYAVDSTGLIPLDSAGLSLEDHMLDARHINVENAKSASKVLQQFFAKYRKF